MRTRLIENEIRNMVKAITRGVINETRLDYDEDNFSGNYSRGPRYDIYFGSDCIYHDVPEEAVDRLADEVERTYGDVTLICNDRDEEYIDAEGYLDDPDAKNDIENAMYEDGYYDSFPSDEAAENDYSWNLFDNKGIAPGAFGEYYVKKDGLDDEIDHIMQRAGKEDWSPGELRNGRRNMDRWIKGRRSLEDIEDSWADLHY